LILDTNVVLYKIKGLLDEELPEEGVGISILTKIELLSYSKIQEPEKGLIELVLDQLAVWPVEDRIADAAIQLRRQHNLKIPDAVIAATAISLGVEMISNDAAFLKVGGLKGRQPKLKSAPSD